MNLSRKIAAALDENTRAYVLPCTVSVEDGPNRLTLDLTALDSVGVAFDALEFASNDRTDWPSEALNAWGRKLADRVTYLLEPLKVLEVDAGGGEVQIRSGAPSPRADQRGFYEVRLRKSGVLRMERFVFDDATRQRRRTPCQLTREVLERLADDIVASAS
ncbi:MAG: hypothetical protein U0790_20825 [Isosphaeraceae bacterium]